VHLFHRHRRLIGALALAMALGCTPRYVAPSSSTIFRRDSIKIATALEQMRRDSAASRARALAQATETLRRPVVFLRGSTALSDEAKTLLNTKAWFLWYNPQVSIRVRGAADTGLGDEVAIVESRARVDAVRSQLRARGIALERIGVEEGAAGVQPSPGEVAFDVSGTLDTIDVPPPSAMPPAEESVPTALEPSGRMRVRWGTVRLFYATDRRRTGKVPLDQFYGGEQSPDGSLELGRVEVTIPRVHRPGWVERPVWYRLERTPDPNRHMTVKAIQPLGRAATLDSLRQALNTAAGSEVLVFIHGYNVTFHDAALRTAQLTYDLGFKGPPILYSWPSQGAIYRYSADRESALWSADHLARLLDTVVAITGPKRVNVIAHSMGNLVLTEALSKLAFVRHDTVLANLVLAAPDVPLDLFRQQLAPAIRRLVTRLTIYMSAKDKALWASRLLSTHLRLGEATNPVRVFPDMDTIDASEVATDLLGHGYIASAQPLLDDLDLLVDQKQRPPRGALKPVSGPEGDYWTLR